MNLLTACLFPLLILLTPVAGSPAVPVPVAGLGPSPTCNPIVTDLGLNQCWFGAVWNFQAKSAALWVWDHNCVPIGYNPDVPTPIVGFSFNSELPNTILVSLDMTAGGLEYRANGLVGFWTYPVQSDKCYMVRPWGVNRWGDGFGEGDTWEICVVGFKC